MSTQCHAITKKAKQCKNKAVDGEYCNRHKPDTKRATSSRSSSSASDSSSSKTDESGAAYNVLIQANEALVNALTRAIEFVPGALEKLFKYSGTDLLMPKVSSSVKNTMSDQTRNTLEQIRNELEKLTNNPGRYAALELQTKRLESIATDVLLLGGRFIPKPVKNEISKALKKLKDLSVS